MANDGTAYKPRLLKSVTDATSGEKREAQAVVDGHRTMVAGADGDAVQVEDEGIGHQAHGVGQVWANRGSGGH